MQYSSANPTPSSTQVLQSGAVEMPHDKVDDVFLASLPWYDLPEIRDATDTLWTCLAHSLRKRGFDQVPEKLNRELPFDQQWTSERLLFSQACGYDVLLAYRSSLRLVGTPVYTVEGCRRALYSSVIVVRRDSNIEHTGQLRRSRCVINSPTSHSGMNMLRAIFASVHQEGRFFSAILHSGSHEASLSMVADGLADVASIDRVTYALIERYRPLALRKTRMLCCSMRTPAPPYVTGSQMTDKQVDQIRQALTETLAMPSMKVAKEALLLDGLANLPLETYRPIIDLQQWAARMGYHEIPCISRGHRSEAGSGASEKMNHVPPSCAQRS